MRFLNFSSDSPNYREVNGSMIWNVSSWTLEDFEEVALSSCFIFFDKIASYKPIILTCSLVDADYANYDGVLTAGVSKAKCFVIDSNTLEFWKIDCSRPRTVMFTLKGMDAQNIKHINITLALK